MRVRSETGTSRELTLDDADAWVRFESADPVTVTVPPQSRVRFSLGTTITLFQAGEGAVTIQFARGDAVVSTPETLVLAKQYASAVLVNVGGDAWDVAGYLTAAG